MEQEDMAVGLEAIARQIRQWLKWNRERRAPIKTEDDTAIMVLPVPYWPTHGQFENWIKLFEETVAALRGGQVTATDGTRD